MANTINFIIPTIGATADPTWESYLNTALTAIQTHTHDGANAGALLLPAAISFAAGGFDFNNKAQINAAYLDLAQQSVLPFQAAGHGSLATDTSGNLYYVSPTANVLLASTSSINYTSAAKGFVGSSYGVTGGAAFYLTSSATWPFNTAFYLYTSTATPTDDTGARAGLGTGLIAIKGSGATDSCGVYFTETSGLTTERPFMGILSGGALSGSTRGEWGLKIIRAIGSGTTAIAFTIRETLSSANVLADAAPAAARTYGFHLNGSPSLALSDVSDHYTIRANIPGSANNAIATVGYITRNLTDGSGAAQTPTDGFGLRHTWNLQRVSLGPGFIIAAQDTSWANFAALRGRHTISVATNNVLLVNPAIDVVANSAGTNSVGLGIQATYGSESCLINMATAVTGTLSSTLGLTVSAGGLTVAGASTITGTLAVGSITSSGSGTFSGFISSGPLTVTGGANVSGLLTSTTFQSGNTSIVGTLAASGAVTASTSIATPSITLTDTTLIPGLGVINRLGIFTAYLAYADAGTAAKYNITGFVNLGTGDNEITFPFVLNANALIFAQILGAMPNVGLIYTTMTGGPGTNKVRIKAFSTQTGVAVANNCTVQMFIVGG